MTQPLREDAPALLDHRFPLPIDRPFTNRDAVEAGVGRGTLGRLVAEALVRRVLKGVYVAAQVEDTQLLRARALARVVPQGSVITDWSACWLHTGLHLPGDHLRVPSVSMFRLRGQGRLRNALATSGERTLLPRDIMEVHGLLVTVPIRTAWDLGRFARRDNAIGALDALLRHGTFSKYELLDGVERFRRQRGVVRLREVAPLADPRAESPTESVMRLRWLDTWGLPPPEPQISVRDASGHEVYRLDLGVRKIRFAAEYDGEQWHTREADKQHDEGRRRWLDAEAGWTIRVLRKENIFGVGQNASEIFREGITEARRRTGRFKPAD